MRCRECAARVAATARVCSGCGAPIVGQPPVVADTVVADTVVAGISDAAGKAVPAGVAGQTPEPYVPGSGDRVPAKLRLVLGGYAAIGIAIGIACLSAGGMALASGLDPEAVILGLAVCSVGVGVPLLTLSEFWRLLRRPSDPHTATVMASKRGGRTLILDIPWDGTGRRYQPLSEVRLALWMKAGMLVPGERVTVYGGPGGENPLLISSAQRGRAFLGAIKSRSTVQPGPVAPLDEKVSDATLVDWAAWAASTTFPSTGRRLGYDKREVDAFRSAVRDAFLGVGEPPVRSDDVRGKQFSTHWLREGYDKKQVDAFLEAAGLRLAAMKSTDRPAGPFLISGATLVAWAEWADSTTFSKPSWTRRGYKPIEVDAFREEIRDTFLGATRSPVKSRRRRRLGSSSSEWREVSNGVRGAQFSSTDDRHDGYDKRQVAAFLDAAGIRLAAMESTDRPDGPLVSGAILAGWAEWADSRRFLTRRLRVGYDKREVDAFRSVVRDTFLGGQATSSDVACVPRQAVRDPPAWLRRGAG